MFGITENYFVITGKAKASFAARSFKTDLNRGDSATCRRRLSQMRRGFVK
jgi:hypothetical protein